MKCNYQMIGNLKKITQVKIHNPEINSTNLSWILTTGIYGYFTLLAAAFFICCNPQLSNVSNDHFPEKEEGIKVKGHVWNSMQMYPKVYFFEWGGKLIDSVDLTGRQFEFKLPNRSLIGYQLVLTSEDFPCETPFLVDFQEDSILLGLEYDTYSWRWEVNIESSLNDIYIDLRNQINQYYLNKFLLEGTSFCEWNEAIIHQLEQALTDDLQMGIYLAYQNIHTINEIIRKKECGYTKVRRFYNQIRGELKSLPVSKLNKDFQLSFYLSENEPIYDFELPNISNQIISTKDYRGTYLLLNFWSGIGTFYSEDYNKHQTELSGLLMQEQKLKIVGISVENLFLDIWKEVVENQSLPGEQVFIKDKSLQKDLRTVYGINQLPAAFLVNPKGELVAVNPSIRDIKQFIEN